jgi:hypothetical protein
MSDQLVPAVDSADITSAEQQAIGSVLTVVTECVQWQMKPMIPSATERVISSTCEIHKCVDVRMYALLETTHTLYQRSIHFHASLGPYYLRSRSYVHIILLTGMAPWLFGIARKFICLVAASVSQQGRWQTGLAESPPAAFARSAQVAGYRELEAVFTSGTHFPVRTHLFDAVVAMVLAIAGCVVTCFASKLVFVFVFTTFCVGVLFNAYTNVSMFL